MYIIADMNIFYKLVRMNCEAWMTPSFHALLEKMSEEMRLLKIFIQNIFVCLCHFFCLLFAI